MLQRFITCYASLDPTEYNVQILVEKYLKRKVILDCYTTLSEAYDPSNDPYDLLDRGEEKFTSIRSTLETKEAKHVGDIIPQRLNSLEERQNCKGLVGIPSGIKALDEKTAGWQNGDLVIIAGRPSMGKTAFVLTAARNATDSIEFENKSVAIFSMEMGNDSLTDRLLAMEAGVSGEKMRNGTLSEAEVILVHEAASRLYDRKILLDDTSGLNLNQLKNKAKKLARTQNIGMIIVDYIGLMDGLGEKTREQEIAVASRGLKRLAKELNVPIIVLSQLSRLVEQRGGSKRPMLSDLRDSGSIEQDADVVLFLYRPEYYNVNMDEEGQPTAGVAEIIIAKQRNGATGSVKARFIKEQGEFRNLTPESFLKGLDLTPTKAA